jgi:hypothetical protein
VSSLAYGRLVREDARARSANVATEDTAENKLVAGLAGLIPAEVIAAHAIILTATTKTTSDGTTTISSPDPLGASLWGLLVLAVLFYLVGRGLSNWTPIDVVRLALPPAAFLVWAALIGTSALSPWIAGIDHAWLTVGAALLGGALIAVSTAVAPKKLTEGR